ncbi:MAG TPA: hypothetical protein VJI46_03905 [Candidatus Nanoarchaeia archaeon]|nr:hypothetical protein [Candidatus Nanoarchaeia archaeon]
MTIKFGKLFDWLLLTLIIWIVYELIKKILGGSLGYNEIMTALLALNLGLSFNLTRQISGHIGWHKGMDSKKH